MKRANNHSLEKRRRIARLLVLLGFHAFNQAPVKSEHARRPPPNPASAPRPEQRTDFVPTATIDRAFQVREWSVNGVPLPYRLRRPAMAPGERAPLIIWFHGLDEWGLDNRRQLKWMELLIGTDGGESSEFPAFILAPQLPHRSARWDEDLDGIERVELIQRAVQHWVQREPIDPNRIYLIGISQGAAGAWAYAERFSSHSAAQLLLAPNQLTSSHAFALPAIPTWAFQSESDGLESLTRTRNALQLLSDRGVTSYFTAVDTPTHDCWTTAFRDYRAASWLLRHRRGQEPQLPFAIWITAPALIIVALRVVGLARSGRRRSFGV